MFTFYTKILQYFLPEGTADRNQKYIQTGDSLYEYLENIFKEGDKDYVPYTEEHQKLFSILDDRNMEVI